VTFSVVPDEYHYNPIVVAHGGRAYTTLDIQVRYLRPLTRGTACCARPWPSTWARGWRRQRAASWTKPAGSMQQAPPRVWSSTADLRRSAGTSTTNFFATRVDFERAHSTCLTTGRRGPAVVETAIERLLFF
jgi:hypothetical protein